MSDAPAPITNHQHPCTGMLAGIAICRSGFPNKLAYPEFKGRFNIIGATAVAKVKNDKAAAPCVTDLVKLEKEKYPLGHTLIVFRVGIGGWMEEQRENKIGHVMAGLQVGAPKPTNKCTQAASTRRSTRRGSS